MARKPQHYRPGTERDIDEIARVFRQARSTQSYLPRLHGQQEERAYLLSELRQRQSLCALVDDCIVGFALFENGWLHHLYVGDGSRGAGIGTELVRRVQRISPLGLELWVFQRNEGACRFYERLGFERIQATQGQDNEERLPDFRYRFDKKRSRLESEAHRETPRADE